MKEDKPNIGIITKSIISRIESSAERLAVDLKFNCYICKDTGFILDSRGYKRCDKCPNNETGEKKNKFF